MRTAVLLGVLLLFLAAVVSAVAGLYYWVLPLYRRLADWLPLSNDVRKKASGHLEKYLPDPVWKRWQRADNVKVQLTHYVVGAVSFSALGWVTYWCVTLIVGKSDALLGLAILPLAFMGLLFLLFYYPLVYVWKEPFVSED